MRINELIASDALGLPDLQLGIYVITAHPYLQSSWRSRALEATKRPISIILQVFIAIQPWAN